MATLDVLNTKKEKVGSVEVADEVFKSRISVTAIWQVINAQLAGQRSGNACTKTKGEVRGGGKKPFKQKHTGRARQGSTRSPLMPGGGITFGPKPRSYKQSTPKKMVYAALRGLLSDRLKDSRIIILDNWAVGQVKTAEAKKVFDNFGTEKALVLDKGNMNLALSVRNLPTFTYLNVENINAYDIANNPWLIMTKEAALEVNERLRK